jgi:very-short-patch-repair endonuclease
MFIIENTFIRTQSTKGLPKNKDLINFSKENRKAGVLAEVLFWKQVHKGKFYGINFNRQKIIGNYIVDFYVPSLSLVIEIDGCSHIYKEEYDLERDSYLKSFGLKVFKIADIEVKRNLSCVMNSLRDFIISEYSMVNIS